MPTELWWDGFLMGFFCCGLLCAVGLVAYLKGQAGVTEGKEK